MGFGVWVLRLEEGGVGGVGCGGWCFGVTPEFFLFIRDVYAVFCQCFEFRGCCFSFGLWFSDLLLCSSSQDLKGASRAKSDKDQGGT